MDEQLAVSMEEYWRGMEDKSEVVNETIAKEKRDIGDVVQRIRESAAVKAAEAHRLDQEYANDQ